MLSTRTLMFLSVSLQIKDMNEKEKFVLDHYDIHTDGRVYSNYTNKFLKTREDKDGYFDVALVYDDKGSRRPFRVGRLVALRHLPRVEGHDVVNHKDLNKQNDNVDNLEWSTIALNTQHGYDNSAYEHIRKVKSIGKDGTEHVFPSTSHAARFHGYANSTTVQAILEGRRNNPIPRGKRQGLFFEYSSESVTTIERVAATVGSE